jgi:Protein of unknown function (DUF1488)
LGFVGCLRNVGRCPRECIVIGTCPADFAALPFALDFTLCGEAYHPASPQRLPDTQMSSVIRTACYSMYQSHGLGICSTLALELGICCIMPLTRGSALGYDVASMTFSFTMIDDTIRVVHCKISGSAMNDLDQANKGKGTLPKDRNAQFATLRDRIEEVASGLFDLDKTRPDTVRIFHHQVRGREDP